jgi:hypothetical protein
MVNRHQRLKELRDDFARAARRFIQPLSVTRFGEPIQWVDTTRHLAVTLDKQLIWSPYMNHFRKRTAGFPPEQDERTLHKEWNPAVQAGHPPRDRLCVPRLEVRGPLTRPDAEGTTIQVSSPR